MSWLEKFENNENTFNSDGRYVKLSSEQDITIDMVVDPVRRDVKGTDGRSRTYWDITTKDGKILSCTNYLFGTIRKELDRIRGETVTAATICIRKVVVGEKVSWVVVLKNVEP